MTSRVTRGRPSAPGGWSHSCVTAVTSPPRPRANSVSVADGTRETMRMATSMGGSWIERPDALERDFAFDDFRAAVAFVNRVADVSEEADHHPDILVHGWNKVRLSLATHSEGGRVTDKDPDLARRIDAVTNG